MPVLPFTTTKDTPTMCDHEPHCAPADQATCFQAASVSDHTGDQGWELLCNGVILFDDGGAILPGGKVASIV